MKKEFKKRILSSIILLPMVTFTIIEGSYFFYFLLILTLYISASEWISMTKSNSYKLIGLIFLLISFYTFYKLRINSDNNYTTLILIISICVLTDIGGFIFGKIFKGPRLSKISPNKTYAGAIGSLIMTISSIPFFMFYNLLDDNEILASTLFFVIVSVISQTGDLTISYFKRLSNVKDTGKLIPGHGGLLDRIDGIIFAIPFSYILLLSGLFKNIFI